MSQSDDPADFEFLDDDALNAIPNEVPSMQNCTACGTEFCLAEGICPLCGLSTMPDPEPSQDALALPSFEPISRPGRAESDFFNKAEHVENESGQLRKNGMMICPHCHTRGQILTEPVTKKTGVSGTKLAAAMLTGGWSILAVGLSKKDSMTRIFCLNCGAEWHIQ